MIPRIASKLLSIVLVSLVIAPAMIGLNHRTLSRFSAMSDQQLRDHEVHILGHGLTYQFILCAILFTFLVAIVDGLGWCIRTPFVYWSKQTSDVANRRAQVYFPKS